MSRTLIAYFSRAGENACPTGRVNLRIGYTAYAAALAEQLTGADAFKIELAQPYSPVFDTCVEEVQAQLAAAARPALRHEPEARALEECRTLILCSPNFCGTLPPPVLTFLEGFDWAGRTVLPLITHGGGGAEHCVEALQAACPGAAVRDALVLEGSTASGAKLDVQLWLAENGIGMEDLG